MQSVRTIQTLSGLVAYTLRKRKGHKKLTLSVTRAGLVMLTVPLHVSLRSADAFVEEKRIWIAEVLQRMPTPVCGSVEVHEKHYRAHKERARVLVHALLLQMNRQYGFSWGRVAIRATTSRWGSCSSKKNLNFDYRILFLPAHLQEYLIAHELCHLQEMNHSPRFWALVARAIPRYVECRKELRAVRKETLMLS
jgi:predicted metal-dependent hydrolase